MLTACVSPTSSPTAGSGIAEGIRITLDGKSVDFGATKATFGRSGFGGTERQYVTFTSTEGKLDAASGMRSIQVGWSYPSTATGSTEVEKTESITATLYDESGAYQTYSAAKPAGLVITLTEGKHGVVDGIVLALESEFPKTGAWPARTLKVECNTKHTP